MKLTSDPNLVSELPVRKGLLPLSHICSWQGRNKLTSTPTCCSVKYWSISDIICSSYRSLLSCHKYQHFRQLHSDSDVAFRKENHPHMSPYGTRRIQRSSHVTSVPPHFQPNRYDFQKNTCDFLVITGHVNRPEMTVNAGIWPTVENQQYSALHHFLLIRGGSVCWSVAYSLISYFLKLPLLSLKFKQDFITNYTT